MISDQNILCCRTKLRPPCPQRISLIRVCVCPAVGKACRGRHSQQACRCTPSDVFFPGFLQPLTEEHLSFQHHLQLYKWSESLQNHRPRSHCGLIFPQELGEMKHRDVTSSQKDTCGGPASSVYFFSSHVWLSKVPRWLAMLGIIIPKK